MRLFLLALLLWSGLVTTGLAQQDADTRYLSIYEQLQQADALLSSGQVPEALAAYQAAHTQLQSFQQLYPGWDADIVSYRLNDLTDKIAAIKAQLPASTNTAAASVPATPAPPASAPAISADQSQTMQVLRQQLASLKDDNTHLQAKLREALSAQPQSADTEALAKASDGIRELMKENDLLRASQHARGSAKSDAALAQLQAKLDDSEKTLEAQKAQIAKLTDQNHSLQLALDNAAKSADLLKRLHEENQRLQAQLAAAQSKAGQAESQAAAANQSSTQLAVSNEELAKLKSAVETATLEKTALEERIKQMTANLISTDARFRASLDELKKQRDELADKLKASSAPAPAPQTINVTVAAPTDQILHTDLPPAVAAQPVTAMQASASSLPPTMTSAPAENTAAPQEPVVQTPVVQAPVVQAPVVQAPVVQAPVVQAPVVQAPVVQVPVVQTPAVQTPVVQMPATPQPVAESPAAPATPVSTQSTPAQLPPDTSALVASAQQHFANHEFNLAEADYHKILDLDPGNAVGLANLAAIELNENKLDDANQHISAALAKSPDDAYNLAMRGKIEFARADYDNALRDLNYAAELDANNPETQNYLGLTLDHLGRIDAAEAALVKAIKLDPNYAPAHNNLAVIYMSEDPPLPQLARWHYQKALDAGQPRNPELEKLLAQKGAAVQSGQK